MRTSAVLNTRRAPSPIGGADQQSLFKQKQAHAISRLYRTDLYCESHYGIGPKIRHSSEQIQTNVPKYREKGSAGGARAAMLMAMGRPGRCLVPSRGLRTGYAPRTDRCENR